MSLKDSLLQKLETQSEKWSKQIDNLRSEADARIAEAQDEAAEAEVEREFAEKIKDLEGRVETARQELSNLRDAGEDKLQDLKARIDDWLPSNAN